MTESAMYPCNQAFPNQPGPVSVWLFRFVLLLSLTLAGCASKPVAVVAPDTQSAVRAAAAEPPGALDRSRLEHDLDETFLAGVKTGKPLGALRQGHNPADESREIDPPLRDKANRLGVATG